jgi:DNA-binding HxlR family transcriptional regulator
LQAFSLLATPLNVGLLRSVEDEALSLVDLRRSVGIPSQTAMRTGLRRLTDEGVLEISRSQEAAGSVCYALSPSGRQLLEVADALEAWLESSDQPEWRLGTPASSNVIKAVAAGWSSGILRAVAARPLTLTQLNRLITDLNYPSLERRIGALRLAGLVERVDGGGRGIPYGPSEWMRQAVGPLTKAIVWERKHLKRPYPAIGRMDVEAGFLLAVPLLRPGDDVSGIARLTVEVAGEDEQRLAGVTVEVESGRPVACRTRLAGKASGWASGSISAWLSALTKSQPGTLEIGGDRQLADSLVDGLGRALFARRIASAVVEPQEPRKAPSALNR